MMKAAMWKDINQIEVVEIDKPKPSFGQALIKIHAAGVCITDYHIISGGLKYIDPPHVMGHEISGEIVELGSESHFKVGDRVVVETSVGCGVCEFCIRGDRHLCANGTEIGFTPHQGGYAQYVLVPFTNLVSLPDEVSYEEAAILECVVCPIGGLYRLGVSMAETVAVFGVGPAGIAFIQGAKAMGAARVIAVARDDEKLERAKHFGADIVINLTKQNLKEELKKYSIDTICEASGAKEMISLSFSAVKKGGRVLLYGIPDDRVKIEMPTLDLIVNQVNVYGICANPHVWQPLLSMIKEKKINLIDMVTHSYSLGDINEAFKVIEKKDPKLVKAIVKPWE